MSSNISRRGFLTAAAAAGSLAVLSSCSPAAPQAPSNAPEGDKEPLSTTGTGGGTGSAEANVINPQIEYKQCTSEDFSYLFEPLQIGSVTLKNRIVKCPAGSDTFGEKNQPVSDDALSDTMLDYYERFAEGGAALIFTESAIASYDNVDLATRTHGGWFGGRLDQAEALLGPLVERIHKHGALAGFQTGVNARCTVDELTLEDIEWVQQTVVDMFVGYQKAGYDVGMLHCSAQQVPSLFMTKRANHRTDQYGCDTLENRTRFACEIIQKAKEACGKDFPIMVLINAAEDNDINPGDNDGFYGLEDSIANAKMLEAAGADTFYVRGNLPSFHVAQFAPDVMFSGYKCEGANGFGTRFDFDKAFGGALTGTRSGAGIFLEACEELKKNVSVPVSCAGYVDPVVCPDLVSNAFSTGQIDYIMMNRPLTVDPELPNKLQAGKRDEIAPCCRCMHCHHVHLDTATTPETMVELGDEYCRVNACTQQLGTGWNGRVKGGCMPEGATPAPAATAKNVVVVGGGPAGMEAARIAAIRGHNVTLLEKDSTLGGLLKTAHVFKGEHENMPELINYLARQQEVHGVTVNTGTEADADAVAALNPDAVVIAVGGKRESKLSSSGNVKVLGITDVVPALTNGELGQNVVILGAGAQAVDMALYLMANGVNVQLVHGGPKADVDKEQSMWVKKHVTPYMYGQGVKFWNESTVKGLTDNGITIVNQFGSEVTLPCDAVIEMYDMVPNTDLYNALKDKYETVAVGDCDAPWNIADAIIHGNLAGRAL